MWLNFGLLAMGAALGMGLAMDAFSVSLANGLNEPKMGKGRMCTIAGVFAFFQFAMPIIGWFFVTRLTSIFEAFQKFIPWIALILLCYIGGSMIYESLSKKGDDEDEKPAVGFGALIVQGIATSIDALSVGFSISEYTWYEALVCCSVIAVMTFAICMGGLIVGKKSGTKLADKSGILGGGILILIGLYVFIKSFI
ncbi:MAG: manganese efflux pump [Clostridia bacterium]|nr:manganese efflux pump [Clostridia bacterium]